MSSENRKMFSVSYDDVLKKFPLVKPRKYIDCCNPLLQHIINLRKYSQKVENLIQLTKNLKEVDGESERNAIIKSLPPIPDLPNYEKQPESHRERKSDNEIELSEDSINKILSKAVARILFVHGYTASSFNLLKELGIIVGDFIKAIIFLMFKDVPQEKSFSLESLDEALNKKGINGIEGLHAFYVNHIINYHNNLNSKCIELCTELENNLRRPENTVKCLKILNKRRSKDNCQTINDEKGRLNDIKEDNDEKEESNKINIDIGVKEGNNKTGTDEISSENVESSSPCEISYNILSVNQESPKTNLEIDTRISKSKYHKTTIDCTSNVALDTVITSNVNELTSNSSCCVVDSPNNKLSCQSKKRKLQKLKRCPKKDVDLSNSSCKSNKKLIKKLISKTNSNFHQSNKKLKLDSLCLQNDSKSNIYAVDPECNSISNPLQDSKSLQSENFHLSSADITKKKENSGSNISDSESVCIQKSATDTNLNAESSNIVNVDSVSSRVFPKLKNRILKKSPDFCFKPMKNSLPVHTVCNLSSSEDNVNEDKVNDSKETVSDSDFKIFYKSTKKNHEHNVGYHNKKLFQSKIKKFKKEKIVFKPNLNTKRLLLNLEAKQAIQLVEKTKFSPLDEKKNNIQNEIPFENKEISDIPSEIEHKHLEHSYSTHSASNELNYSEKTLKNQSVSCTAFDMLQESNHSNINLRNMSELPGMLENKLPIDLEIDSINNLPHQIVESVNDPVKTQNISETITNIVQLINQSEATQNSNTNTDTNLTSRANLSLKASPISNKNRNKVKILNRNKKINSHLGKNKLYSKNVSNVVNSKKFENVTAISKTHNSSETETINYSQNSTHGSSSNLSSKSLPEIQSSVDLPHTSSPKLSPKSYLKIRKRWTSSLKPKKKFSLTYPKLHLKSHNVLTIKKLHNKRKANSKEEISRSSCK